MAGDDWKRKREQNNKPIFKKKTWRKDVFKKKVM